MRGGAGTGAIRNVINAKLNPNDKILIHDAPIYPTSKIIMDSMGLEKLIVDFNDLDNMDEKRIQDSNFVYSNILGKIYMIVMI